MRTQPKPGDKVRVPWWQEDPTGESQKVDDLLGYVERVDGGYYYVKIVNNPRYDVIELYDGEFKVMDASDPGIQAVDTLRMKRALDRYAAKVEKERKAKEMMRFLGIPITKEAHQIDPVELYNIISNPKKYKNLMSKLKMKVFW